MKVLFRFYSIGFYRVRPTPKVRVRNGSVGFIGFLLLGD